MFPGGGMDKRETPEEALRREVLEETGAILEENLECLEKIYFDWDENWAKTEKQRKRYKVYRGEEMHIFRGEIVKLVRPRGDPSDVWKGKKFMEIDEAIRLINTARTSSSDMKKYLRIQLREMKRFKEMQLKHLRRLR